LESFGEAPAPKLATPVEEDVLSALMNLGYQRAAAERALAAAAGNGKSASFDLLFRETLAALNSR
jgi:Holliday junction DNA helicase RuvA